MDPCVQISEVSFKVCRIGLPRQAVHPGGGVALEHEERLSEQIDAEVVKELGELLLPPLLSCLPYAGERLGHTSPTLCPVCALLDCVPLGPRPWLRRLRHRLPGIVRRLHGYYGGVRLPTVVHHRLRLLAFPMRTRAAHVMSAARPAWDLPVPVQEASAHARVCDHAGSSGRSQMARPCVWPSTFGTVSAPGMIGLYRGRDGHYWPPPAQIRACAANALGSYLECLTLNRWFGHGCSTRGDGRNRLISRTIRSHVSRCRWLRRRRLRNQMMLM